MSFFNSAVDVLQTLVIALGAGLAIWGAINLFGRLRKRQSRCEIARDQTAHGGRRCGSDRHYAGPVAFRPVWLMPTQKTIRAKAKGNRLKSLFPLDEYSIWRRTNTSSRNTYQSICKE